MRYHIDDKTAVKLLSQLEDDIPSAQNHEALAIQLVRQHTRIPVPRLYQTWSHHLEEGMTHLIMDLRPSSRASDSTTPVRSCRGSRGPV